MGLNEFQTENIKQIWKTYTENGEKFVNASQEYNHLELDQRRRDTIPDVLDCINRFLKGEIPLE